MIVLGVGAQWIASRLRVPAILLLLLSGMVVGPIAQLLFHQKLIAPSAFLGDQLLQAIVSLSVAIILFEGGLTLNLAELRHVGRTLASLVTLGALVSWMTTLCAAHFILHLPWNLSTLIGAILIVTGPTVIGPMLRHVKPIGNVGPLLRWEGIVIDPIGAVLALLVFESIAGLSSGESHVAVTLALTLTKTIVFGGCIGFAAAALLVVMLKKFLIADELQNPMALGLVVASFVIANLLQDESGLLAVTVMGVALANQRRVPVKHILEFKETLSILLVSSLFVLLSARLDAKQLSALGVSTLLFVFALIAIGRPLSVWLATVRSQLRTNEQVFLAFLAPRGIVAAAVSSVFALRLREVHVEGAERLVPITFAVIIASVIVYGLGSPILARRLKLSVQGRGGFLIAGANSLASAVAIALKNEKQEVLVVDTNHAATAAVRLAGVPTVTMSVLSGAILDRVEGAGYGRLLALTPNEEVNTLAAVHFSRAFGRSRVFHPATEQKETQHGRGNVSRELVGRILFGPTMTYDRLVRRLDSGGTFRRTTFTAEFTYEKFLAQHPDEDVFPLLYFSEAGEAFVIAVDDPIIPKPGMTLVYLIALRENLQIENRVAL